MNEINELESLINWFIANGKYESSDFCILIGTLGNPGWRFYVNLKDTPYEEMVLSKQCIEISKLDWITYCIENKCFKAYGGPFKLKEMINIFFSYFPNYAQYNNSLSINFLQNWFYYQCDGDWEDHNGIRIRTEKDMWNVKISLFETQWEPLLNALHNQSCLNSNFDCVIEDECFVAQGTKNSLSSIVSFFHKWILDNADPRTRIALEMH